MIDLATLVAPLDPQVFIDEHWPHQPYWSNEDVSGRASVLESVPELESAEAAMAGAPKVLVFRPDGKTGEVPGAEAAMPLYKMGLTCYIGTRHIPILWESVRTLTSDLGLPDGAIKCEIFCSSGESGLTMHSDFDLNFALLVRGSKRWRIAPNDHIRNQTAVCKRGKDEQVDPHQLELADKVPFPDSMPSDSTELTFGDGGLLFMPRGWWHETKAEGECLQVNFVVNWPQWRQVLTAGLERRLLADPEWREYAYDLFGSEERRDAAIKAYAERLRSLRAILDVDDYEALARDLLKISPLRPPKP